MKKSFFIGVALGMFTVLAANAQKSSSFAGTIKISNKYEGDIDPKKHYPHERIYTISGNKIKMVDPHRGNITIFNGDAVTVVILYDITVAKDGGYAIYKSGYTVSKEVIEESQFKKKYTYVKKDETKTICGYVCTRYDITIYDTEAEEETKATAYTTTEIGENSDINNFEYPGLTGFPLYVESEHKGVKTFEEAIEVKETKVKSVDFLIPTAYKMFPSYNEWGLYINAVLDNKEED